MPKEDHFYYTENDRYINNCIGTLFDKEEASVNNTETDFQ